MSCGVTAVGISFFQTNLNHYNNASNITLDYLYHYFQWKHKQARSGKEQFLNDETLQDLPLQL